METAEEAASLQTHANNAAEYTTYKKSFGRGTVLEEAGADLQSLEGFGQFFSEGALLRR